MWQRIEKEFNSNSGRNGYRTVKNLKEKYNNLKKTTKKKFSENKMKITQTGGGGYVPIPVSDIDKTIKDILGEQIDGLKNTYDSDVDVENSAGVEDSTVVLEVNHEPEAYNGDEEPHSELPGNISQKQTDDKENDWSHYSSQKLRQPVSSKLIVNKEGKKTNVILTKSSKVQKKIVNKNTQLIEAKLDFVLLQKQKFLEEHDLKMEIYRKKLDKLNNKL